MNLYTIGYEGRTLAEYIRVLKKHSVTLVVDVRLNPMSRKKGFSRHALSEALSQSGIRYCHMAQLGNPKEIRAEYHKNGSAVFLYEQYKLHLDAHPEAFQMLIDTVDGQDACLMCFERLPAYCHRGAIVEYVRERLPDVRAEHL